MLKTFIRENLRYPKEALEKGIEGDVIVKYKVTGKGEVIEPEIVKSLGYGCDEEALRLTGMLSYMSVKNRGVRVITDNKIKIPFRIRKQKKQVSMTYKAAEKKQPTEKRPASQEKKKPEVYTYTIQIK